MEKDERATKLIDALKDYVDNWDLLSFSDLCDFQIDIMGAIDLLEQYSGLTQERAQELERADMDGRVAVLPCTVGATVYTLFCDEVIKKRIGKIIINGYTTPMIWVELDRDFMTTETVRWDLVVGKTVFLHCEEAYARWRG